MESKQFKPKLILLIAFLTIWMACSKDEAPAPLTIEAEDFNTAIDENPLNNSVIGQLSATASETADLRFSMKEQSVQNALSIKDDGEIMIADSSAFDFELRQELTAVYYVSAGETKDSASVTISVNDVDELEISVTDFTVTVAENPNNGQVLGTVNAQTNDGSSLNFNLSDQSAAGALAINDQGQLIVADSSVFDFELNQEITANCVASSQGIQAIAAIQIIITDLNDVTELVANDFNIQIDENPETGFVLGTVDASINNGNELTYSITSQSASNAVSIDANTGELTVSNASVFDFESNTSIQAGYRVTDGEFTATASITITVNYVDEPTIVANNFEADITENPSNGDVIGMLDATHSGGSGLTFSITSQSLTGAVGLGNASTGQIVVADAAAFDFEVNQQITATYEVTDGTATASANIILTIVNDESDDVSITANEFTITIDENPANGTILGTVDASANNTTNTITYSLQDNAVGAFSIDSNTGELSIADDSKFDYEVNEQVRGVYEAVVNDTLSATAYVVVNLNNLGEIQASDFTTSIDENPAAGDAIGTVSATIDNGNSMVYSLTSQSVASAMSIDQNTGQLTVNDPAAFDYELNTQITATFQVSDPTSSEAPVYANITVTINDMGGSWSLVGQAGLTGTAKQIELVINNGTPVFSYNDYTNVKAVEYTGSSWQFIGGNITGNVAGNTDLISNNGEVYIAYTDPVNSDRATVKKYGSGTWTALGGNGFSSGTGAYIHLAFTNAGTPWVVYKEAGTNGTKVNNYDSFYDTWNDIVGTTGGVVSGFTYGTDIAINPVENRGYVAYSLNGNGGGNNVQISYYANIGGNPRWRTYGNLSGGSTAQNILEIGDNGVMYVLYKHSDNKLYVERRIDINDTWTMLGGSAVTETVTDYDLILVDDLPYLVYVDATSFELSMKRWNGSTWQDVSTDFAIGANPNLAVDDSTGEVYIAFGDGDYSQGVTVMKWQDE